MEDRYLFKAKRVDDGEWIVGGLVRYGFTGKEKYYIVPDYASDLYAMEIDQNTICQCTGLKDKNSNLIWENDVVDFKTSKAVVIWDKAEWRIKWIKDKDTILRRDLHFWTNEDDWKCEVIGNIFDNPELLESEG
jgi:uncharacterized phage protein (TIGR01671 family)